MSRLLRLLRFDRLPRSLRPEEWLAAGYLAAGLALFATAGLPFSIAMLGREYAKFLLAIAVVSVPIWAVARGVDFARGRLDRRAAVADLLGLARGFAMLLVVLVTYTNLKSRIARLNPRLFDDWLLDLDALVHFGGGDFLSWLLSFTHQPGAMRFWSTVYFFAWLALALPFGIAFARGGATAARRLTVALALAYVAGSLLYLALPSLGPAFAYRPRFAHLAGSAGFAVQESMLRAYLYLLRNPEAAAVPFFGIAAFPSLHLATTGLGLCAAWRWAKPMLWFLVPANLAVAWSALLFGWHYAIDFYPGLALAWGAWWVAGRVAPSDTAAGPEPVAPGK